MSVCLSVRHGVSWDETTAPIKIMLNLQTVADPEFWRGASFLQFNITSPPFPLSHPISSSHRPIFPFHCPHLFSSPLVPSPLLGKRGSVEIKFQLNTLIGDFQSVLDGNRNTLYSIGKVSLSYAKRITLLYSSVYHLKILTCPETEKENYYNKTGSFAHWPADRALWFCKIGHIHSVVTRPSACTGKRAVYLALLYRVQTEYRRSPSWRFQTNDYDSLYTIYVSAVKFDLVIKVDKGRWGFTCRKGGLRELAHPAGSGA
jgi:hypothetical protein